MTASIPLAEAQALLRAERDRRAAGSRANRVTLPFPPASLSGHANGGWRSKSGPTAKHRELARLAALAAGLSAPATGDIHIHVRFVPPDRRGDRTNYPNRLKPYFDGLADALGVNDRRFLPAYEFAEPQKPGRVEITIAAERVA